MSSSEFVSKYEAALRTQDWAIVGPLIHERACVVFSDGSVHKGKAAVQTAYERNFSAIKNEDYRISELHWLHMSDESAAYMFDFHWTGNLGGKRVSGSGRGTAFLVLESGNWLLLAEHLGPYPSV